MVYRCTFAAQFIWSTMALWLLRLKRSVSAVVIRSMVSPLPCMVIHVDISPTGYDRLLPRLINRSPATKLYIVRCSGAGRSGQGSPCGRPIFLAADTVLERRGLLVLLMYSRPPSKLLGFLSPL